MSEQAFVRLPTDDVSDQWLPLGTQLWSLHRELSADALDFTDVAKLGSEADGVCEQTRKINFLSFVRRGIKDFELRN